MSDSSAAAVTLLGIPYDAASSFSRGPARAPRLIREALHSPSSNLWTEDGTDLGAPGTLGDAGDIAFADPDDRSGAVRARIEDAVAALLGRRERPIILGGDHSVTYPVLSVVRRVHPRLTILHVDAHPDLYDDFEGDRFSHASPFARIMERGLADRLVQVGIRTMNGQQRAQAERFGVEVVDMRTIDAAGTIPPLHIATPVYVSLDLDALDPAFAPGVSHREPGGLTPRQAISLIQRLDAPLVGADVVEYNPHHDTGDLTARLAAKLVKELAATMLRANAAEA